ncbi:MAG TPA: YXWGXW repeat-containing protein [Candidatus Methylacidiphilales bacterium]|nr:YXWGXW repeat-containing protein [Candidatus Methylacidiphilales bacterium]
MNFRNFFSLALLIGLVSLFSTPAPAQLSLSISIGTPPPPLPFYVQPPLPAPGYIWTPGYWAWDPDYGDYYWVPGTWVLAPQVGYLWTPPWWGWSNGLYVFHRGYWGPHVGFYGGIAYGYGYTGTGYQGGYWNHGQFFYNRSVSNVTNVRVNVYTKPVTVIRNNVSYNGGKGGISARPTAAQLQAGRESHLTATSAQLQHVRAASANTSFRYSSNQGRPAVGATTKPGVFPKSAAIVNSPASNVSPATRPSYSAPVDKPVPQENFKPQPGPSGGYGNHAPPPTFSRPSTPPPHPAPSRPSAPPAKGGPPQKKPPPQ